MFATKLPIGQFAPVLVLVWLGGLGLGTVFHDAVFSSNNFFAGLRATQECSCGVDNVTRLFVPKTKNLCGTATHEGSGGISDTPFASWSRTHRGGRASGRQLQTHIVLCIYTYLCII